MATIENNEHQTNSSNNNNNNNNNIHFRSYFWNCILYVNDNEHPFYDVRVKQRTTDGNIQLFTSDLPPIPILTTDTIKVCFTLERNSTLIGAPQLIFETHLSGTMLNSGIINEQTENQLKIINENCEWKFMRHSNAVMSPNGLKPPSWLLFFLSVRIPIWNIKRFLPHINC
eukprot:TRINITY_DN3477_c0_g1_i1.p1 TRINITY_DN3477_c0_g1~~TRINITY_DN3477_c0_g1_i1.p1  ORF type:complete len:186 (-),score=87.31 TRINITY_DN3477_c0_g1_i1:27-539(-)